MQSLGGRSFKRRGAVMDMARLEMWLEKER